jgi:hypothetical protein
MSKLFRVALLAALGAGTLVSATLAGAPDPAFSSCDSCLVVSPNGMNPDGSLSFRVTVRDQFANPVAGAAVIIDIRGVPVSLCSTQDAGFWRGYGYGYIGGTTNQAGEVRFTPRGWGSGEGVVRISANGVDICSRNWVSTPDLSESLDFVVDVSDLAVFADYEARNVLDADLNGDGSVDVSDLALFAANEPGSSAGFCP